MIKPLHLFTTLVFTSVIYSGNGQDVILSQPYANQLYLNPAFTGTSDAYRLNTNYRYQWGGAYTTAMLSYDQNIVDSANGIGMLAEVDNAAFGLTTNTSIMALYAHNFPVAKSLWLSGGIKAGIISTKLNETLRFPNGVTENIDKPAIVGDVSVGVMGYGKNYYAGFAVDHLAEPQQNFAPGIGGIILRKCTFTAGGMINLPYFTLSPNILLEFEGSNIATSLGLDWIIKNIVQVGVWYKPYANLAPFAFMAGLQFKYFHVGYSLDPPNTSLTPGFGNGYTHEFSLALLLPSKTVHSNKINCPNF